MFPIYANVFQLVAFLWVCEFKFLFIHSVLNYLKI
jgi:hypothetical protein